MTGLHVKRGHPIPTRRRLVWISEEKHHDRSVRGVVGVGHARRAGARLAGDRRRGVAGAAAARRGACPPICLPPPCRSCRCAAAGGRRGKRCCRLPRWRPLRSPSSWCPGATTRDSTPSATISPSGSAPPGWSSRGPATRSSSPARRSMRCCSTSGSVPPRGRSRRGGQHSGHPHRSSNDVRSRPPRTSCAMLTPCLCSRPSRQSWR